MSEECTHDCSNCGAACSSRDAAPQHDAPNPNSSVKKVIGVVSGKGGVGKSMTSALLACAMARRGYHCGILDADITGPSIPKLFGIHGRAMADDKGCWPIQSRMGIDVMSINLLVENEEDPVVWRGPVIAGAVKQFWTDVVWKDVDFLFVDMPPGTGDVQQIQRQDESQHGVTQQGDDLSNHHQGEVPVKQLFPHLNSSSRSLLPAGPDPAATDRRPGPGAGADQFVSYASPFHTFGRYVFM